MADPFPPSLPGYESPHIYDSNMTDAMEDLQGDLGDPGYSYPSPFHLFSEQTPNSSAYSSGPLKNTDNASSNPSQLLAPHWSQSPESSSGSESSNHHERKNSSESSAMGETPVPTGILVGADPVDADAADEEASNKFMNFAFDFESAASSPSPALDKKASHQASHPQGIKMPVRPIPVVQPVNSYTSKSSGSSGSPEAGLSMVIKGDRRSWVGPSGKKSKNKTQKQLDLSIQPSALTMPEVDNRNVRFPHSGPWTGPNIPAVSPFPSYHPPQMAMPYASPITTPQTPRLYVSNFPAKTRVETQHMLKYTLDPLPPGVKRLHLQPYTMSKHKLMANPTPERSSDMLELFATVVCSSAMDDNVKRERALARAKGPLDDQDEHRPSSGHDASAKKNTPADSAEDDESKPLNGGPVKICNGCIERERRRAERKKVINPEEQEEWQRVEAQRTVVFNISEVREWQQPSPPKLTTGKERTVPVPYYDSEPTFSPHAMQVDIPTRISCYCRHQEEKIGFRIIFTIRDYKDNVVAQTMSSSIMITDDHKTHPAPNPQPPSQMMQQPQVGGFFGPGVFQKAPSNYYPAAPFARNAFSATDLPRMNQQYDSRMSNVARQLWMSQETSETTSTTLTPRNLSRPASPTMTPGQHNKRRKASGSSRMRSELMMTKYPTTPLTSPASATSMAPLPFGGFGGPNAGSGPFLPNYAEPAGFPITPASLHDTNTNPPTPTTATSGFSQNTPWAQRSQSLENLTQRMMSEASSTEPSRVPSPRMTNGLAEPQPRAEPNGVPYANGYGQNTGMMQHAQLLTNSLRSVNGTSLPQQMPVILNLSPAEGPIAGGTQVTVLGTGFSQGLEIMFGDARATTTTYWGENTLLCLVPPAVQAGTVAVTFKHHHDQNIAQPPERQQYFRYTEGDQTELMRLMLDIMSRNFSTNNNGQSRDILGEVRNIAQHTLANGANIANSSPNGANGANSASNGGSQPSTGSQGQALASAANMTKEKMEEVLIKCLEQMDLDEGPAQANLNFRGPNGQAMLHLTASLGYYRVAAGLLARGAHPDIRDNNGMSPMHMASLHGNVRIIRKLRSAGGDPSLRSLNGFTPADMTTAQGTLDAINALDQHTRPRSAFATPISGISRAPSVLSRPSSVSDCNFAGLHLEDRDLYRSHSVTPAQMRARSRRTSFNVEERGSGDITQKGLNPDASQLATQSALTAWRDQLSVQIQQFQQTVHRALPPLPNLPDYQDYPVVRRISSLVPQRNAQLSSGPDAPTQAKETDYHWWELLTGASSSPPAYEDIYPDKSQQSLTDKKAPFIRAVGEAFMDRKCEATFDHTGSSSAIMETVRIGSKGLTQEQQDRLRSAHAQKIKRLRSDRNLFFIWIPLLILVILAMLKDRAPQLFYATQQAYSYLHDRFQGRVVQEVL